MRGFLWVHEIEYGRHPIIYRRPSTVPRKCHAPGGLLFIRKWNETHSLVFFSYKGHGVLDLSVPFSRPLHLFAYPEHKLIETSLCWRFSSIDPWVPTRTRRFVRRNGERVKCAQMKTVRSEASLRTAFSYQRKKWAAYCPYLIIWECWDNSSLQEKQPDIKVIFNF